MQTAYAKGFSKLQLVVIVLFIILFVGGGFIAYLFFTQNQQKEAVNFANSFVKDINNQNTATSFQKLSSTLATKEGAYFNWLIWSSEFKQGNVTIKTPPSNIDRVNKLNIIHPKYTVVYTASNGTNVYFHIIYDNSWHIDDYGVEN